MDRTRVALALLGLGIVVSVGYFSVRGRPKLETAEPSRPNIVLVIIDALRADKMSAYGYPKATSPEIDALADRGVRFARVIAQSSWTRPSIGSLLTSRYPRSIGIYKEKLHALDGRFETLAEILKRHGYTTMGATANPNINSSFRFDRGFDRYVDSDVLWDWMTPETGKTSSTERPLHTSREVLDGVLAWVDENGAPPYYVQVNLMEVHQAFTPPVRKPADSSPLAKEPAAPYLLALQHVSAEIGRFVESLVQRPGWRNTLLVITSDHGQGLTDHPNVRQSIGHGLLLYESQLLVPLIFYSAAGNLPTGRVVDERVRLLDVMPTLLEYAEVPVPDAIDGVSLMSLIRGSDDGARPPKHFVVETEFKNAEKIGVYAPEWKYIENRDEHGGTNPRALHPAGVRENGRRTDVAEKYPEVTAELQQALHDWEGKHPKAPPAVQDQQLSPSETEQLRALGYIE